MYVYNGAHDFHFQGFHVFYLKKIKLEFKQFLLKG